MTHDVDHYAKGANDGRGFGVKSFAAVANLKGFVVPKNSTSWRYLSQTTSEVAFDYMVYMPIDFDGSIGDKIRTFGVDLVINDITTNTEGRSSLKHKVLYCTKNDL